VKSVEFHPEAEAEFIAAAQYYEGQAENLGLDFISVVERSYQRLMTFPESGHPFGPRLRRVLVPGFPYGLLYRPDQDRIFIVAVAHLRRRPGYWRHRE
jgi:plasmid stabilization system protein ParE